MYKINQSPVPSLLSNENMFTFYDMKLVCKVKTNLEKTFELSSHNFMSMESCRKAKQSLGDVKEKEGPKVAGIASLVCAANSGPPGPPKGHMENTHLFFEKVTNSG